ncbi:NAD(P)-binding domain-containing protein [Nocardiopsis sp. RSe5-2]|uniref:NAD(P)-binding domain-containing protein n=1 Tax=Nocardiopsis endophytica TaxID=3018445 RepID=A0ABT4U190_9ACTN|nr:NAD(P)-binding domain-containing protein [Nocardiopsis endophytica]MDA2810722.1 NAD(P)-binding domain-containing protein [Nocardiopsis endophytica]
MERIGIIGVGEIGRAIVEGLCDGVDTPPEVNLSPRGARTAAALADTFDGVRVCADNQEVADRSDLVVIAVRRQDRAEALAGLRIRPGTTVVSAMAGVSVAELRETLGDGFTLVRAIPLPSVRERRSTTVTWPSDPVAEGFFDRLGRALPIADEEAFGVFSALTGTFSAHYRYLTTLTEWAVAQGVPAEAADRYVRGLFQDTGRALADTSRTLDELARDHETPNGNNERIRTTWFDESNARSLTKALDGLLDDIR